MVKHIYDKIADSYDRDIFNIYSLTRETVRHQIKAHVHEPLYCVLDFGIGTGMALLDLIRFGVDIRHMIGNDISNGMLAVAHQKLGNRLETICDDLANIHSHVKDNSQNLVFCHYLFSYCDLERSLASARQVLAPGGLVSIATTTKQNFAELYSGRFETTRRLMDVKGYMDKAKIPNDHDDLIVRLKASGFSIVQEDHIRKSIAFQSYADIETWGLESGWAASFFEHYPVFKLWLSRTVFGLAKIFLHPLYPLIATTDISVVLARREG